MKSDGYACASRARRASVRAVMPRPLGQPLLADLGAAWSRAFSLIELLIVVALIGTIAAIALPLYMESLDNARVARAIGDIYAISREVQLFWFENGRYPATLAEIDRNDLLDPYGNLYVYGVIDQGGGGGRGGGRGGGGGGGGGGYKGRKDKFLVPVNSDFDIYSKGKDGATTLPFTAANSHDDIVRAANGGYIGLAEDF